MIQLATSCNLAQKGREAAAASTSEEEGSTVASSSSSPEESSSDSDGGEEGHYNRGGEESKAAARPSDLLRALLARLRREEKRRRRRRRGQRRQRSCNRTQRESEAATGARFVRRECDHEAATEATDDDGREGGADSRSRDLRLDSFVGFLKLSPNFVGRKKVI